MNVTLTKEFLVSAWGEATKSTWPRPHKFTAGEYDWHLVEFAKRVQQHTLQQVQAILFNLQLTSGTPVLSQSSVGAPRTNWSSGGYNQHTPFTPSLVRYDFRLENQT